MRQAESQDLTIGTAVCKGSPQFLIFYLLMIVLFFVMQPLKRGKNVLAHLKLYENA